MGGENRACNCSDWGAVIVGQVELMIVRQSTRLEEVGRGKGVGWVEGNVIDLSDVDQVED